MLYAMLAYHDEHHVQSWSEGEDAQLMEKLEALHARQADELGPAARLGATGRAVTVRGRGMVTDGPFAETKEQLLGFYIFDCEDLQAAVREAESLTDINPSAVYELRPIVFYRPGKAIPLSDFGISDVR
jgi:hypothetical protein